MLLKKKLFNCFGVLGFLFISNLASADELTSMNCSLTSVAKDGSSVEEVSVYSDTFSKLKTMKIKNFIEQFEFQNTSIDSGTGLLMQSWNSFGDIRISAIIGEMNSPIYLWYNMNWGYPEVTLNNSKIINGVPYSFSCTVTSTNYGAEG